MSLEITGKLLLKYDTQVISDKFKKREFVIELAEEINGNIYTNYAKLQLVQAKCDIIDRFNQGDLVKVSFNIKGNKWEKDGKVNYISNLDAWRVEAANSAATGNSSQSAPAYSQPAPAPAYSGNNSYGNNNYNQAGGAGASTEAVDDLPF